MTRTWLHRSLSLVLAAAAALGATVVAPAEAEAHHRRVRVRYGYRAHYSGEAVVVRPYGLYTGIGLMGTRVVDQAGGPEQLDHGGGITLYGGVRLGERLALELGWLGSFHNPATVNTWYGPETDFLVLEGFTADARIMLDRAGDLEPFVQGGVGFYALGSEHFGLDSVGTGFQLGGGFDYYVAPQVTIGLRVLYRGVAMGPPRGGDDDVFISAATVEGSVALHF